MFWCFSSLLFLVDLFASCRQISFYFALFPFINSNPWSWRQNFIILNKKADVIITYVTLHRRKNTLTINTIKHNKIFTKFYIYIKKEVKKICTYQNIFSSPLALIPSGMSYRPNNLKTQNKNHVVLFHGSIITNCRPNATECL